MHLIRQLFEIISDIYCAKTTDLLPANIDAIAGKTQLRLKHPKFLKCLTLYYECDDRFIYVVYPGLGGERCLWPMLYLDDPQFLDQINSTIDDWLNLTEKALLKLTEKALARQYLDESES